MQITSIDTLHFGLSEEIFAYMGMISLRVLSAILQPLLKAIPGQQSSQQPAVMAAVAGCLQARLLQPTQHTSTGLPGL